MIDFKKNMIFDTTIEGYGTDASGVCHVDGRAFFIPYGIKGEGLSAKITKIGSAASYARIERLYSPSEFRIEPSCGSYKSCGGCMCLHMSYEEELRFKEEKVNSCLRHIGKQNIEAEQIIPSGKIASYRNKVTYSVSEDEKGIYFGFYSPRSHNVVRIHNCEIQNPRAAEIASALVRFMSENKIAPYNERTLKGSVRHIFIRNGYYTSDTVLCISSAKGFGVKTGSLVSQLTKACPYITGIVLNINKEPGNELLKGDFYTLYGSEVITDKLCGFSFRISPQSFFQINPPQAEKLYNKALEYISEGQCNTALELYCGIGTISMLLSSAFYKVIGVELVPQAIENAIENANRNNVNNVEFICADAAEALALLKNRELTPDAVLVDPPRKGMSAEAIDIVCEMSPERIVYVSCDPATLSRDILRFNNNGYTLTKVTAVDMFPRTSHVESVCLLSKVNTRDGST